MDSKRQVHPVKPATPPKPKPSLLPKPIDHQKTRPPVPKKSPVAHVKPITRGPPIVELSTSPNKVPPPLPSLPPKGAPDQKRIFKPRAPSPESPPNGEVDSEPNAITQTLGSEKSPPPESISSCRSPEKTGGISLNDSVKYDRQEPNGLGNINGSIGSPTGKVPNSPASSGLRPSRPPQRPPAPSGRATPKPLPRLGSSSSQKFGPSSPGPLTVEESETNSAESAPALSPVRQPPVPRQRNFEKVTSPDTNQLPVNSNQSPCIPADRENDSSAGLESHDSSVKTSFKSKTEKLLITGSPKTNHKRIDGGRSVVSDVIHVNKADDTCHDVESLSPSELSSHEQQECKQSRLSSSLKIPPRRKKGTRRSRDSSPGSDGSLSPVIHHKCSKQIDEGSIDHDNDVGKVCSCATIDQNANSVNTRPSLSDALEHSVMASSDSSDQDNNEGNKVKKLAAGFASVLHRGLSQQISTKVGPPVLPKPRSRKPSEDVQIKTNSDANVNMNDVCEKLKRVMLPVANSAEDSSKSESRDGPEPSGDEDITNKAASRAVPKVPPLPEPRVCNDKTVLNEISHGGEDRDSFESTSGQQTVMEDEPPPPVPERPPHHNRSAITGAGTGPMPSNQVSRKIKRPLPPLPPSEDDVPSPNSRNSSSLSQNRPLPVIPIEDNTKPTRKALSAPNRRQRSKSAPGPEQLKVEELRPKSQALDNLAQNSSEKVESLFLALKEEARKINVSIEIGENDEIKEEKDHTPHSGLRRSVSREGRPVFTPPPPPPVESLPEAFSPVSHRSSQTSCDDTTFDSHIGTILEESGENNSEVFLKGALVNDSEKDVTMRDKGAETDAERATKKIQRPSRPAPPPPRLLTTKNSIPDDGQPISCDEQGYLRPVSFESSSDCITEYSYAFDDSYPKDSEKSRTLSSTSSSHIYEFVDSAGKLTMRSDSIDRDNTYEIPGEILKAYELNESESNQANDTPKPPPRVKRKSKILHKNTEDLSLTTVIPVNISQKTNDNEECDYILPEIISGHEVTGGNGRCQQEKEERENEDNSDDDYLLAGGVIHPLEPFPLSPHRKTMSESALSTVKNNVTFDADISENDEYVLPTRFTGQTSTPNILVTAGRSHKTIEEESPHPKVCRAVSTGSNNSSESHEYFDMSSMRNICKENDLLNQNSSGGSSGVLSDSTFPQRPVSTPGLLDAQFQNQSSDCDDTDSEPEDFDNVQHVKMPKTYSIAHEIETTEEDFVAVLRLLNLDFRRAVSTVTEEVGRPIIPSATLNQILHYLPQLEKFSTEFLQDIKERMETWDENTCIADIFVKKGPFLKLYISYIKDFDRMMTLFDDACKKYPIFNDLVRDFEASERCASLALKHYMLKPIQRIPQYRLLLQDYVKHLTEESSDYKDAMTALDIVSQIAHHANESMREGDNFRKLLEIQSNLVGNFEVVKPGRTLIKMGMLQKLSRKEAQSRMLFLFNDVLLYTTPVTASKEYKLNHALSLAGMKACEPLQEEFQNEFSIVSIQRSFTVSANTPQDRDEWLDVLTKAIDDNAMKRSTFEVAKTNPESIVVADKDFQLGLQAPVWVPDARVTMCMLCTSEFTVTWRRHHCRACGRVVCGVCSIYKAPLQYLKNKAVRVCHECFEKLDTESGPINEEGEGDGEGDTETKKSRRVGDSRRVSESRRISDSSSFKKSKVWKSRLQIKRPSVLKEVHASDQRTDMSGYMKVLRGKKWKRRWFVIKDKVLYTYKASEDMAASASQPLLGFEIKTFSEEDMRHAQSDSGSANLVKYFENVEPSLVFQIFHLGTDPLTFRTESASSKDKWISAIREAMVP